MKVSGSVVLYALVALVTVGGALYAVVFMVGGSTEAVTSRVAIISGLVGPVIGVLILLLQQARIQDTVQATKDQVNGHLAMHMDQQDDQVQALVDKRISQLQVPATDLEVKPPSPPTGGST